MSTYRGSLQGLSICLAKPSVLRCTMQQRNESTPVSFILCLKCSASEDCNLNRVTAIMMMTT